MLWFDAFNIRAGFMKSIDASSSTSEMFIPPKAVAWAEVGRCRKLNTEVL